jgi:hypothetical protein
MFLMPNTTVATAAPRLNGSQSLRLRPTKVREQAPPILLAGADSAQRAAVLHELTHTLPEGTRFEEASAFWEVLALAPECRMVIFSGDLEDGTAESLARTLGRRRPQLPVVSLATAPPPAGV